MIVIGKASEFPADGGRECVDGLGDQGGCFAGYLPIVLSGL